ncbi:hypothetical protein [Brevibacillus parabrevis]|uniref:hypothetical protein n=1 Tax=Brevibacillus parabrevis TaxID=54914 RepID=UPI002E2284A3|nr:hypothetical protein [Brevibacillus parabrevis]
MVIVALAKPPVLDLVQVIVKELNVTATLAYRHIFQEVIELIAIKRIDVAQVITSNHTS